MKDCLKCCFALFCFGVVVFFLERNCSTVGSKVRDPNQVPHPVLPGAFGLGGGQVVQAGQLRASKDMLKILRLGAVPVQQSHGNRIFLDSWKTESTSDDGIDL